MLYTNQPIEKIFEKEHNVKFSYKKIENGYIELQNNTPARLISTNPALFLKDLKNW